jgi:hypothetical protein
MFPNVSANSAVVMTVGDESEFKATVNKAEESDAVQ